MDPTDVTGGEDAPQDEVSLDRLSEAFAQVMRQRQSAAGRATSGAADGKAQPETHAGDAGPDEAPASGDQPDEDEASDDDAQISPARVLEAMLFVGSPDNAPLTAERAAGLMRGVETEEIHDLIGQLNEQYAQCGCPYHVLSEGPGYRLVLREDFHRLRDKFYGQVRAARLSQAAIDILSIVAYNQPATREQVDELRQKSSSAILNQLVRRQLLRIERTQTKPRKTLYYTTRRFLKLLGLENLDELPQTMELDRR